MKLVNLKGFSIRILIALLSIFIISAVIYCWSLFSLKRVIIKSQVFPIKGLNLLDNKNILILDVEKIGKDIILRNPDILSVIISKRIPDNLIIEPIFRKPIALVYNSSDKKYPIDIEGYILTFGEIFEKLPEIEAKGINFYNIPKQDWRILKALTYLSKAKDKGILINNIRIENDQALFILRLSENEEVIVPQIKSVPLVTDSLQIIVSRFRIEGKLASKIDFTSDKPVVTLRSGDKSYSK